MMHKIAIRILRLNYENITHFTSVLLISLLCFACSKDNKEALFFYKEEKDLEILHLLKAQNKDLNWDTTSQTLMLTEPFLKKIAVVCLANGSPEQFKMPQERALSRFVESGGKVIVYPQALQHMGLWQTIGLKKNFTYIEKFIEEISFENKKYKSNSISVTLYESIQTKIYSDSIPLAWSYGNFIVINASDKALIQVILNKKPSWLGQIQNTNYERATSPPVPDATRFSKTTLIDDLFEPMELKVLSNGDVLFIQRRGEIFIYEAKTQKSKLMGKIPVFLGLEDGLLGLELHPDFERNHLIYLFYSAISADEQHVSQFKLTQNGLDTTSEKILLRIPEQRQNLCCHSAGSLYMTKKGELFIATGDNTDSHHSNGFAPLDERPGMFWNDAQRTSANTMSLNGKILRIKPNEDGTYQIPDGNLFEKTDSTARPEIYVMGARNPYRIGFDERRRFLYWGDVGPDVGQASAENPNSYDEFNQAKKPGYFGWPYFIGDNYAYSDFDFASETHGPKQNQNAPINNSPNNNGKQILPPAQPALIWYPYTNSKEFPTLGTGGRSAIGGLTYYSDRYKNSETKLPEYYDGVVFIMEWMRDWVKAVFLNENGDKTRIEDIFTDMQFAHPIDMDFGPDGSLYVLEYGPIWWGQSPQAKISRITYNGKNRAPIIRIQTSGTIGALPLTVTLSGKGTLDPEAENISYQWKLSGIPMLHQKPNIILTFTSPGIYYPRFIAKDSKGNISTKDVKIIAGNTYASLSISSKTDINIISDQNPGSWNTDINDLEDKKPILENMMHRMLYFPNKNEWQVYQNTLASSDTGFSAYDLLKHPLFAKTDCKSCHQMYGKSVGPSFSAIAERYQNDPLALDKLTQKIIIGGMGNWGTYIMSAHPQLRVDEIKNMTAMILSLSDSLYLYSKTGQEYSVKLKSTIKRHKGIYVLESKYKDGGINGQVPLYSTQFSMVYQPQISLSDALFMHKDVEVKVSDKTSEKYVRNISDGNYIGLANLSLKKDCIFEIEANSKEGTAKFEIRANNPQGPILGVFEATSQGSWEEWKTYAVNIKVGTQPVNHIYIVCKHAQPNTAWNHRFLLKNLTIKTQNNSNPIL